MDSALTSVGLPAALAIIMFGLGLSLTVGDFARVAKAPKAVSIALICQLLLLPAAAFGLVTVVRPRPTARCRHDASSPHHRAAPRQICSVICSAAMSLSM